MALDRMLVGQQFAALLARNPTSKIDGDEGSAHRDSLAKDAVRLAVAIDAACDAYDKASEPAPAQKSPPGAS